MTAHTHSRHSRTKSAAFHALTLNFFSATQQTVMNEFPTARAAMTREEIAEATGMRLSSVCGRVRELMDKGHLVDRGQKKGPHGVLQQIVGLPTGGAA